MFKYLKENLVVTRLLCPSSLSYKNKKKITFILHTKFHTKKTVMGWFSQETSQMQEK